MGEAATPETAKRLRRHAIVEIVVGPDGIPSANLDGYAHEGHYSWSTKHAVREAKRRGGDPEAVRSWVNKAKEGNFVGSTLSRLMATIVRLQEQIEALRAGELERMRAKLGPLTPQQEEALAAITRGIINKIAHGPISEIRKQAAQPDGIQTIDMIRRVFRLDDD